LKGGYYLSKIFMLSITKKMDELEETQSVMEKIFPRKSALKEFLEKEGYCKTAKNQYIKIKNELIYEAAIEKIKLK